MLKPIFLIFLTLLATLTLLSFLRLICAAENTKLWLLLVEGLYEPALEDTLLDAIVSPTKCFESVKQVLGDLSLLRLGVSLLVDK